MTRETVRRTVRTVRTVYDIKYICNLCGKALNHDDEDSFQNELIVLLNQDECVSNKFRLDLCTNCLEPIWAKVCSAINRDPDDISGSDFEDDR